jgi:polyhydroxybutyrate depolymerase
MAYRLACEVPERFASVAIVGALMWERHREACPTPPTGLVNMLIVHGTDDPFFTPDTHIYQSLSDSERHTILGVDDTLSFWALRSGCDLTAALIEGNSTLFPDCADGTRIALYGVQGARSNWPRTGAYQLNQFGVDAAEMITRFLAGGDDWAVEQPPFVGQARTYAIYVPSAYDPAEPLPVVITLHGRFGSGAGTAGYTRMNEIAEREGFIGLYPDGLLNPGATYPYDTGWNYMLGSPYTRITEPDDGAFIITLLDDLALDLNIDPQRIYVDGLSNGGFMVHHLACNYPDRFAAFGTVAASAYFSIEQTCDHTTPVSMVIIHGTADDNIPWDGRTETINGQEFMISYPVLDTLAFWTIHNGCNPDAIEEGEIAQSGKSPETSVRTLTLSDCPNGAEMQLYGIVGGGHNWPGIYDEDATWVNPRQLNMDINAGEVLWEFFSRHTLSGE